MQRKFVFAGNKALASACYGSARRLAERVVSMAELRKLDQFHYSVPLRDGVIADVRIVGNFVTTTITADGASQEEKFSFEENPLVVWIGEESVGYTVIELDKEFKQRKSAYFESAIDMFVAYPRSIEIDLYDEVICFPNSMGSHYNLSDKYPKNMPLPITGNEFIEAPNEQTFLFQEMGGSYAVKDVNDYRQFLEWIHEIWEIAEETESEFQDDTVRGHLWPVFRDKMMEPLDFIGEKKYAYQRPIFDDFIWEADGSEFFSANYAGDDYTIIAPVGPEKTQYQFEVHSTHTRLLNAFNSGISCSRGFEVSQFRLNRNISDGGYRYMSTDVVALANMIGISGVYAQKYNDESDPFMCYITRGDLARISFNEEVFYIIQTPVGSAIMDREEDDDVLEIQDKIFRTSYFYERENNQWWCVGLPPSAASSEIAKAIANKDIEAQKYILYDSNVFDYVNVYSDMLTFYGMHGGWVLERMEALPSTSEYGNAPKPWTSDGALKLMHARVGASGILTEVYMSFYRIGQLDFENGLNRNRKERVVGAARIVMKSGSVVSANTLKETIRNAAKEARQFQLEKHPDKLTNNMPQYAKGHIGIYDAIHGYAIEGDGVVIDTDNEQVVYAKTFLSLVKALNTLRDEAELPRLSYSHPLENVARAVANKINETKDISYISNSNYQELWSLCRAYQAHAVREVENHDATFAAHVFPLGVSAEDFAEEAANLIENAEYKYYGVGYLCPSTMTPWIKAHIVVVVLGK